MTVAEADPIKVLAFEVFGTVVDWHTSIVREVRGMNIDVDANQFALTCLGTAFFR